MHNGEVSQRPKKFGSQRHWGSGSFFQVQGHVLHLHGQTFLHKASSGPGSGNRNAAGIKLLSGAAGTAAQTV